MNKEKINDQLLIEQLRAESELKTKWLSLIAHDFKGLFSNIQVLLNALASNSISQEIFVSMLPELNQIAEKNSKTLESTFAWINSQAKGFSPNKEDVLIYDLFSELKNDLGKELALKELSLQFMGDEEISLHSDQLLLKFILKQIIENAVKYSNQKGVIEVIAHSDSKMKKVNITIKDYGMGMKDSVLKSIGTFDGAPYTGTMHEKGAGLSLVIVKDFVKDLKGMMNISSIFDEGTSVELEFPQAFNI